MGEQRDLVGFSLTFDPPHSDLMTEMMDMSSDLVGSGIPFLDYRMYAERIFFPGHRESPLRRDLDVQECRRQTVEQGLVQLSNLLNSKLFLTKVLVVVVVVTADGQMTLFSFLSSSTLWRASVPSPPGTEPMWRLC